DPGGDQRLRRALDLVAQHREAPAPALEVERFALAPAFGGAINQITECELFEPHACSSSVERSAFSAKRFRSGAGRSTLNAERPKPPPRPAVRDARAPARRSPP